jgi:hypothetical protein
VNLQFCSYLARVWSRNQSAAGVHPVSISVTMAGAGLPLPTLLICLLTPHVLPAIPSKLVYPYFVFTRYPTNGPQVQPGAQATISSTSNSIATIPKRIYIMARANDATQLNSGSGAPPGFTTTDTFAFINSITVNFADKSGQLSSASAYDLFHMSRLNGCNLNWSEWSQYVGSIICLEPGKDLGLSELAAPGLGNGSYTLQVNATITNPTSYHHLHAVHHHVRGGHHVQRQRHGREQPRHPDAQGRA